MGRIETARRRTRRAAQLVRNRLDARSFARTCAGDDRAKDAEVAVYFADGPENLYQLHQWLRLVEDLPYAVTIVVSRPDTGRLVRSATTLPVVYAPGSAQLESLVDHGNLAVVLYLNHLDLNFRMLRFPDPVHVHLGHGESDKDSSITNQKKAYDLVLVSGQAAADRLATRLRGFDAAARTRQIGRPQLDLTYDGAPDWSDDGTTRVLYAPTWEGDRPSMAYGSVATHGVAMVTALAADPSVRVIYRPHPRGGFNSPGYAAADRAVRAVLAGAGDRHLVDTGAYGWQWAFADACIADVSSVAYDWLATAKPMLVTVPDDPRALAPRSRFLDQVPRLAASESTSVLERVEDARHTPVIGDLAAYYFGDTTPGASTRRFRAAVDEAVSLASERADQRPS